MDEEKLNEEKSRNLVPSLFTYLCLEIDTFDGSGEIFFSKRRKIIKEILYLVYLLSCLCK